MSKRRFVLLATAAMAVAVNVGVPASAARPPLSATCAVYPGKTVIRHMSGATGGDVTWYAGDTALAPSAIWEGNGASIWFYTPPTATRFVAHVHLRNSTSQLSGFCT